MRQKIKCHDGRCVDLYYLSNSIGDDELIDKIENDLLKESILGYGL